MNPVRNYLSQSATNKDYTKDDKKMYEFFLELEKIREREKNRQFNNWLDTAIDYNNYYYDEEVEEYSEGSEENIVKIKAIINNFTKDLKDLISSEGYLINNENKFKDEIASCLYKDSI